MKILLIGANGTIGKEVKQLLKEKGHEVIEASRSTSPSIDISNPADIEKYFSNLGKVDAIVSAAGDAAFSLLKDVSEEEIQLSVNSKLLGQVNLTRKGLQNLNPGGVIVLTGGILAYSPIPQTSLIAMVNAGLEGFARAAALELTEGRRIVVVHPDWVSETAAKIGLDASSFPDAKKTATAYLEAIESTQNGEPLFVEGFKPDSKF